MQEALLFSNFCRTFLRVFLMSAMTAPMAMAQQFKVEKVKGNKAVIEFSGGNLSAGRNYSFGGSSSEGDGGATGGARRYVIGGNFDLQYLTYSSTALAGTATKDNLIGLLGRFGWNFESSEIGFILGYANTETSTTSYSLIKAGGFYDYNLTQNRAGKNSVYGVGAEASYGSITSAAGGSVLGVYASAFAKWFVFGPSTALRVDLGYSYDKGTYTSYSTTTQGLAVRGGLATYF